MINSKTTTPEVVAQLKEIHASLIRDRNKAKKNARKHSSFDDVADVWYQGQARAFNIAAVRLENVIKHQR